MAQSKTAEDTRVLPAAASPRDGVLLPRRAVLCAGLPLAEKFGADSRLLVEARDDIVFSSFTTAVLLGQGMREARAAS